MSKKKEVSKKRKVTSEEVGALKAQLARALADYDNLRKRVEKERDDFGKVANVSLLTKLLSVLDMLEEAQETLNDSGLAIIIKEFAEVFKDEGVEKIKVDKGTEFDENLHEAVEIVETNNEVSKGEIVEEVLSGWYIKEGNFVVRPAKVKVKK